ncbi:sensor histidine kinase [Coprobacter tertius]|nr:ATP-binding protein [Coprobacter tertius]
MILHSYKSKITGYTLTIVFFSIISVLSYIHQLYFTTTFAIAALFITAYLLYRQLIKCISMTERLVSAFEYSDFDLSFHHSANEKELRQLSGIISNVIYTHRSKLKELETKLQYFNTLLGRIDFGLMVINKNGEIEWMNSAARTELRMNNPVKVSDLAFFHPDLPPILSNLKAGEIKIITINRSGFSYEIIISAITLTIQGKKLLLVSLKNIQSLVEETEIEAWKKLIRVLTHEIMNTLAPIISLSETAVERLKGNSEKDFSVLGQIMQTIHRRSTGLLNFVENYRKLTRIPAPEFSCIPVNELFDDVEKLTTNLRADIIFSLKSKDISVIGDRAMIEQVLLNLIKNAAESGNKTQQVSIIVEAINSIGFTIIAVSDNGKGIVPEALDKIFIPFYTTKTGGSGIGLNLCKQIMRLHGGSIRVTSKEGKGSRFTLIFSKFSHKAN